MSSSYELLLGLALLAERQRQQQKVLQGWTGVLVKLEQQYLLIERKTIKEIVTISLAAAPVIDKREWLTGLMSHEGVLLPLIELRKVINPHTSNLGLKERQVIIVNGENGSIGLLVDQIVGSRDYWIDDLALSDIDSQPAHFFSVAFSYEGRRIHISDHEQFVATIGLTKR